MIEIEFCIGRMVTFAPMTVASYLQAGQRYLTQKYEEVICDLVTTLSYRDGNSAFNKRYGRKGDEQLSLSTFVKDVLANGTRLIEAKETEAKRILEEYGFNYETGLYKDDVLPESLCNNLPDMIAISPREDIMHPPDDEWDSAHPNAEIPSKYLYKHRKKSRHSEIDVPAKDVKMLEKEEEHQYSKPDDTPFKYPQKRRSKRIEVSSERKSDMINDYVEWRNSHVRHDSSKVLYLWGVELDSSQVIYIHPDADLVPKQCGTHVKGGKSELRDKKENVVHWNIQVEWDGKSYGITGTRQSVYPQLRAFLLENHLTHRYFIFFSDGESCIYDDIEKWFYCWHYVIYLDFHHAKKKVYELISLAIKSERVEDPSDDPGEYHRGPNKGKPKPKKKTSLSRLYGKVVVSALFAGNWKEAILYLRDINPDDVVKPDALNDLIKYIWRKRHYITCYCIRKKCGLRNSSNGSEGLNNQNVSRRQKSDQKNWCDHGSYAVASLTNCFKNRENTRWFRERKFSFAYVECEEDE